MHDANRLQQRIANMDRRTYALLVGLMIGISAELSVCCWQSAARW